MTDMTMTCAELDERLADYLTDALSASERAAVERHLGSCTRCAGVLASLDAPPAQAAALPVLAPSRDLWAGIASRIEPRVLALAERAAPVAHPQRRPVAWLAAAAVVLVASTAFITYTITERGTPTIVASGAPPTVLPGGPIPASNVSMIKVYDVQIATLDSIVRLRHNQLDPKTVKVIEKNLKLIDKAIAESRAALLKDPRSRFLNDQLTHVLDQKVGLLRTVALLPTRT